MFTLTNVHGRNRSMAENIFIIVSHILRRTIISRIFLGFVLGVLFTVLVSQKNSQSNQPVYRPDQSKFEYQKNRSFINENKAISFSIWNQSWDGIKTSSTASRHLYLIRHGKYFDDAASASEMRLTKLGQEQLVYTGQRLNQMNQTFDHFIHSGMVRARESAQIINEQLSNKYELIEDNQLVEGLPVAPIPYAGISQEFVDAVGDRERIDKAFNHYFHRASPEQRIDTHDILVFHGNILRYFICKVMQYPVESWLRITINHGSITRITILGDGNVVLNTIGDSGFIPADKITF